MKPISGKVHGVLDYVVGASLIASPWLLHFRTLSGEATNTMVIFGIVIIGLSLITNYPMGVIKMVSFPTHGIIETIGALVLLASPWMFGYAELDVARNLALVVGVVILGVVAFTNYSAFQTKFTAH